VVVAFDARAGDVFWARFEYAGEEVRRLTDDRLESAAAMLAALQPDDVVLTDTVGYARSTVFGTLKGRERVCSLDHAPCLRGLACARAAACEAENADRWTSAAAVLPVYLRASYAEKRKDHGGGA
jgi:tRNA A37 threonylcarbamoyladenosine modification protein TsaB